MTTTSQAVELRGVVLARFPIDQIARDGNIEPAPDGERSPFGIGVMVDTAEEVDQRTEQMRPAGARVPREPVDAEFFTGRSAYLCDPEGNYFEMAEPTNPITAGACGPERQQSLESQPSALHVRR